MEQKSSTNGQTKNVVVRLFAEQIFLLIYFSSFAPLYLSGQKP